MEKKKYLKPHMLWRSVIGDSLMLTISGETSPEDTEAKGGGLFNDEDSSSGSWSSLGQSVWED